MGIGDFSELVDYEREPADYDTGTERYHDLAHFEVALLGCIERQEIMDHEIARRRPITPVYLDDDEDDEDEPEELEESWSELRDLIYRANKC